MKQKLTWRTTASTIWHWLDMSFTIPMTLSSLDWSSVGPNIIARFRTSICQHFHTSNLTSLTTNLTKLSELHFNTKKDDTILVMWTNITSVRQDFQKAVEQAENKTSHQSEYQLWSYGHFCIFKMAVSHHLQFLKIKSCTSRLVDPENATLEPNIMSLLYTAGVMLV